MDSTRASLLVRIRNPADAEAWMLFEELYSPLLYRYARAKGLGHADSEDIRSTCYVQIVEQIKGFEYDRSRGRFKAWLRTLVHRRVVDLIRKRREKRADTMVYDGAASPDAGADELWDLEWERQHLRWCIEQVRPEVSQEQFDAFTQLVDEQRSVPEVCEALQLNRNQVYKAKSRILALVKDKMLEIYADDEQPE